MNKAELKDKIIDLDDFFNHASSELRKRTGLERINFLVPNGKNGDFIASNSPNSAYVSLTKKELRILTQDFKQDIFYPKMTLRCNNLFKRFMLIKIIWKLRLHGISAIIPICSESKLICLIMFKGRLVDYKLNKNHHCVNMIRQEITYCLESILLYNQTLEGIMRKCDSANSTNS